MAFLEISSATKTFGPVSVLTDVNLDIERGEFVVFVGPSGCGKSTLLRMISGLEDITEGTISIEGEVMNEVEPADRGAAMVFQSYALYPHMTVHDNVSFGLRMARKAKTFIAERVQQSAAILQLSSLLDRKPAQLSGGQKQRVAIGRAIVREPRVFLFDEPLSNLDAELRVQMRAELMQLHQRLGTTMIYVTHDQVEAMTLADKMVVMNGGIIQQSGEPLTLYDDPDNRFVASFVGSPKMNFLKARVAGLEGANLHLDQIAGTASASLDFPGFPEDVSAVEIGLRSEHLRLSTGDDTPPPNSLVLEGTVTFVEELGDVTFVHLRLADDSLVIARSTRGSAKGLKQAKLIGDLAKAIVFDAEGRRLRSTDRSIA